MATTKTMLTIARTRLAEAELDERGNLMIPSESGLESLTFFEALALAEAALIRVHHLVEDHSGDDPAGFYECCDRLRQLVDDLDDRTLVENASDLE